MNAIQTKQRIDFYINLTASARFTFAEYNIAMNDTIYEFVTEQMGDEDNRDPKNFQWIQQIRDNLYTLIKTATPSVTNGSTIVGPYYSSIPSHFNYPTDYDTLVYLSSTVSGITNYVRPTTYNMIGPLLNDSFRHPSNTKMYYVEDATGYTVYRGTTGTATVSIVYLKQPTAFSIGAETQLILPATALTLASVYTAVEVSVYNGVTYQIGASITGTGAVLTSGLVILASNTSPIDLPTKVHEFLCKGCAAKMLNSIGMPQQGAVIEHEEEKG